MKPFKQFLFVLLTFVLIVSLSGCIIIPLTKYYDISSEEVVSVQFYDLRNQDSAHYSGFDTILEPVYTIPEEDTEDFLDDFEIKEENKINFPDTDIELFIPVSDYITDCSLKDASTGQYEFANVKVSPDKTLLRHLQKDLRIRHNRSE